MLRWVYSNLFSVVSLFLLLYCEVLWFLQNSMLGLTLVGQNSTPSSLWTLGIILLLTAQWFFAPPFILQMRRSSWRFFWKLPPPCSSLFFWTPLWNFRLFRSHSELSHCLSGISLPVPEFGIVTRQKAGASAWLN